MGEVMEQIVVAMVAVLAGVGAGAAAVVFGEVRALKARIEQLQVRLAASKESTIDMGYLMERQRAKFDEQTTVYEAIVHIALDGAAGLIAERDEARAASQLALTFYGRELERAEAAELELERERVVSAGIDRLFGGVS